MMSGNNKNTLFYILAILLPCTWFSSDHYVKINFPFQGTLQELTTSAKDLNKDLPKHNTELIYKKKATELFVQEKQNGNLESIFSNAFQSVCGQDTYPCVEKKAVHLLYFSIKNHPFNDKNKRSVAFSFIGLLQKVKYNFTPKINPEVLTALSIMIAESNPIEKDRKIGIVKLLLNYTKN